MFHLDNNSGIDVMPAIKQALSHQSKWFTEGDAQTPPSYPGQDWFNIIQAEILNVLNEANIQPEKTKLNQLTAAIKCIINNNTKEFLPLSGGQLAGDLIIDKQNAGIKLSTNDTNYTLSTSAEGDAFSFYFPDADNNHAERMIYTKENKTFNFKNCDVKINDSDVITIDNVGERVVETFKSEGGWYRKWSDGWVEQGGEIKEKGRIIVNFLVPFIDDNYSVANSGSYTFNNTDNIIKEYHESYMKVLRNANAMMRWYACGYYK
jgi:hypothetical protein